MRKQDIIEKIRPFCKAHPFARVNSYKNIIRNENGEICGFFVRFPHLCGISVKDDGVIGICVEHADFDDHAEIRCMDDEFISAHTDIFCHLTESQRETVEYIRKEPTKALNA